MIKNLFCLLFCLFSVSIGAQNFVKHQVAKGETITQIAQKYKITPHDIYSLNPDAQKGIQPDQILVIPTKTNSSNTVAAMDVTHTVKPKETIYSILKQYKITEQELFLNNSFLKTTGLQPEQVLIIKKNDKKIVPKANSIASTDIIHEVQPKETKYGIATKYGISVEELEKQNPEIVQNLPIGYKLIIPSKTANKEVANSKEIVKTPQHISTSTKVHNVLQGETLYSLSRQYDVTEEAMIAINPELKDGVKEGMILKIPETIVAKPIKTKATVFVKSKAVKERKKLVLFLPFNASKIQNDTISSIGERLKKDKFLNMTLDFYSGVKMAIDSAKVLGLNLDINIIDSQENKNSTTALSTIQRGNFSNVDAVIGPFYQTNIEKVAKELETLKIPVISPLSKEEGERFSNLYQAMPQGDDIKSAMFEYMKNKNGNIIAAIDPKKLSIKQYIQTFQKDVKIVGTTESGSFTTDSIKKHFVKDRMNYLVLASEKTGNVLTITNVLKSLQKTYQVQLVILEPNETLEYEEIPLSRLTDLKLIYPSINRSNDSFEAKKFERAYKRKNKMLPNQYAIRGFDITFDTMMRLVQFENFEIAANQTTSEQVGNKFDYEPKVEGGYVNKGVYILYYDTDLTIKQAQ